MSNTIYIVDGYNVIHKDHDLEAKLHVSLEAAREALLTFCREHISKHRSWVKVLVVFDGDPLALGESSPRSDPVQAVFSRNMDSADTRIIDFLRKAPNPRACTVVSDDRTVCSDARLLNAKVLSVHEFLTIGGSSRPKQPIPPPAKRTPPPALRSRIDAELRKLWT